MNESKNSIRDPAETNSETQASAESKNSFNGCFFKNSTEEEKACATARYLYAAECKSDFVAKVYLKFGFCGKINSNPDFVEVAEKFQNSAEHGDAYAYMCLGFMYYFGNGVRQNYADAAKCFRKAAESSDELSKICLGFMLSLGKGVQEDKDQASTLFRTAAKCGRANVEVTLGDIFYAGIGVSQDWNYAFRLYYDAANQGDMLAMYGLGNICRDANNEYDAFNYYLSAAKLGYGPALFQIGNIYNKGIFFDLNTDPRIEAAEYYRKAAGWYKRMADQGAINYQHTLAEMYYDGKGVEENIEKSKKLFQQAADHGWAPSQTFLGCIAMAEKNISKACEWLKKAADQEYADAQYMLGIISQDQNHLSEAKEWYQKAADAGNSLAKFKLGAIAMRVYNESSKQIKKLYCLEY